MYAVSCLRKLILGIFFVCLINVVFAGVQDSDMDGVPDANDKCAGSDTIIVDLNGCSCSQKTDSLCFNYLKYQEAECCINDQDKSTELCGEEGGKAVCNLKLLEESSAAGASNIASGKCIDCSTKFELSCQKSKRIAKWGSRCKEKACSKLKPKGKYEYYSCESIDINGKLKYREICGEKQETFYPKWHKGACKQKRCPDGFDMVCENQTSQKGKVLLREKCINQNAVYSNSCTLNPTCREDIEIRRSSCEDPSIPIKKSVVIFIDSYSYTNLENEIERLKLDITKDLDAAVFIFSGSWNNIKEIKDIIINKYINNGLIGAILIGDIPAAYFEYNNTGVRFPSDWYFQDLSDNFIDTDSDGNFEREYYMVETDITSREIWLGRIKPPAKGPEGIDMLRKYFDRNHMYRNAQLVYDKNMLYFGSIQINQDKMSQEDYNNYVNEINNFLGFYDSNSQVESIYDASAEVQKNAYLSKLAKNRDFVFIEVHGSPTYEFLGGSTFINYSEIAKSSPQALFTELASCSNGDFISDNYFAGWYLFSGNGLIVIANSVQTMFVGLNKANFFEDYMPLSLGVTFGEQHKNDMSFLVHHLFGDPTLTLREKPAGNLPKLSMDTTELEFGDIQRGSKLQKEIIFKNEGIETLKINFKYAPHSINGNGITSGAWTIFYYEIPGVMYSEFKGFEIPPGESKTIPFTFYPRSYQPQGRYSMFMLFQTNDPENPYFKIYLRGNGT